MPIVSNYFTIYFTENISDKKEYLKKIIPLFLDIFKPSLGYCNYKPTSGNLSKNIDGVLKKLDVLFENPKDDGEVFLNLKDGLNKDFKSSYHLKLMANNLTYIPSHKVYLPNFIQFYFPADIENSNNEKFESIEKLFKELALGLDAVYGYMNRVVMYDMFQPAKDNQKALDLLKSDSTLDVFDDYNDFKNFVKYIKSPMWLNILSKNHIDRCAAIKEIDNSKFDFSKLGKNLWTLKLKQKLNSKDSSLYRDLAMVTEDISIKDFQPVMFKFPYKYPHKHSKIWINRLRQ